TPARAIAVAAAQVGGAALLMVLSAHVLIPVRPVPVTLQTFAVMVTAGLLGAGEGSAAVALYLAFGAAGLPAFAGASGLAVFGGPTGGYLLGMLLAPAVVRALLGRRPVSYGRALAAFAAAD